MPTWSRKKERSLACTRSELKATSDALWAMIHRHVEEQHEATVKSRSERGRAWQAWTWRGVWRGVCVMARYVSPVSQGVCVGRAGMVSAPAESGAGLGSVDAYALNLRDALHEDRRHHGEGQARVRRTAKGQSGLEEPRVRPYLVEVLSDLVLVGLDTVHADAHQVVARRAHAHHLGDRGRA